MIEQLITALLGRIGFDTVRLSLEPVSGGFLHRMYKVHTSDRTFAVKHLNPEIMKRETAAKNFAEAERLEDMIELAGIPIVPALRFDNQKMQEVNGNFFYVFEWHDGHITNLHHITLEQCRLVGGILGRMHALDPKYDMNVNVEESRIDWNGYIRKAERLDDDISELLVKSKELLRSAEEELNHARKLLPAIVCISDEDMDPKNVMWENGQPLVIDLECLAYGNPVSHALQLSLQWAGMTTCNDVPGRISAFFEGYLKAYDNGFRNYADVLDWPIHGLNGLNSALNELSTMLTRKKKR